MSDHAHDSHTGPIKTPAQLLWTSFFSFVVPVFIIIGLVFYVTSASKPTSGVLSQSDAVSAEIATAKRIARVGTVELQLSSGPRALATGEQVYNAQCAACHASGAVGAPKFGDAAAWGNRLGQGYDGLLASALKGKGNMNAQGGGSHSDLEIGRAVVYMANAAGGKLAEPAAPAAAAAPAPAPVAAVAAPVAAAPAPVAAPAAAGGGEALYKKACAACHAAGVAGAPKLGDKAAWASRLGAGVDGLTASVIKGKGAMPPKGGSGAPDADIKAAVVYMTATVK
ncbi:MAG: c-type cytochrome [Hydrogenophaga sp.]